MIIKWKRKNTPLGTDEVIPEKYSRTDNSSWEEYYIGDNIYLEDNRSKSDPTTYWFDGSYNNEDWYKPVKATKEEIKLFERLKKINKLKDK